MLNFFTYKQVPHDAIQVHWTLNDIDMEKSSDEEKLPGWQKNQDILVTVDIDYNESAINECIRGDCGASFFVTFHSISDRGGTSIHALLCQRKYEKDLGSVTLEGIIDGDKVAGVIQLSFMICIDEHKSNFGENVTKDDKAKASELGSLIFCDEKNIILEGEQTYFPVADVDFSKKGFPADALYFLEKNAFAELDSDFFASYRLYFNNTHPMFNKINAFDTKESGVLSMITYDVYHELFMNALDALCAGKFSMKDEREQKSHTVRTVYINLLETFQAKYYDGVEFSQIHNIAQNKQSKEYNKFTCALQSYLLDF